MSDETTAQRIERIETIPEFIDNYAGDSLVADLAQLIGDRLDHVSREKVSTADEGSAS
jgi:hypothetical protein